MFNLIDMIKKKSKEFKNVFKWKEFIKVFLANLFSKCYFYLIFFYMKITSIV